MILTITQYPHRYKQIVPFTKVHVNSKVKVFHSNNLHGTQPSESLLLPLTNYLSV